MGKVYDDWGRLVEAVLRREKLRQLCYAQSMSSSDSSFRLDGDFSHLHAEMAMVRLREDLIYTLTQNKQCFEHGYMSLQPSSEKDPVYEEWTHTSQELSSSSESQDCVLDLLDPDMIPKIKAIADIMFASNYGEEFCEVFVRFGRAAFAVYLEILDVEEISSDDVARMEWKSLNSKLRKWLFAIKEFIVLYLARAKVLFDQVMEERGRASQGCLVEASKPSIMWFLNLGCFAAVEPHRPEWIFCLLDVYEELAPLIPSVEALFTNNVGSCIRVEFHNLLTRLQDSAKVIFVKLGKHALRISSGPFPNGGVDPLTKNVVNYMLSFAKYDCVLDEIEKEMEDSNTDGMSGAVAAHLHSITSALEASIASRSHLYKDTSLKHIFVMNNFHYMVTMISNSKIKACFGNEWIKSRTMKFRFHALSYHRSTWSFVPSLTYSYGDDKAAWKGKCKDFTLAFDTIYKSQKGWHVPNLALRDELRETASSIVQAAYRTFLGRSKIVRGYMHIKYCPDELGTLLLDLFKGSSQSLSHTQRKGRPISNVIYFGP